MFGLLLLVNLLTILAGIYLVRVRTGTFLNPVTHYGVYIIVASGFAPYIFSVLQISKASDDAVNFALWVTILYWWAYLLAYLLKISPIRYPMSKLYGALDLREWDAGYSRWFKVALAIQFVMSYAALLLFSGHASEWITDSRGAYQNYRTGVGVLWALAVASLFALFIAIASGARSPKGGKLFLYALGFAFLSFFLGSKGVMLSFLVIAVFTMENNGYRFSGMSLAIGVFVVFILFLGVQLLQGTASAYVDTLTYFDYFDNTAWFMDDPHSKVFQYGANFASNFWMFVPRFLMPAKPFVYGQTQITEILTPGVAEYSGATPGLLRWIGFYWDFGVLGVVASGFISGLLSRTLFDLYRSKKSFLANMLLFQFAFAAQFEIFFNLPTALFLGWIYSSGFIFKLIYFGYNANRPGVTRAKSG